jgi:hypothetical protein
LFDGHLKVDSSLFLAGYFLSHSSPSPKSITSLLQRRSNLYGWRTLITASDGSHDGGDPNHEENRLEGRPGRRIALPLIDAWINALGDWRGETLARIRSLIKQADPEVVEEWKWRGVPVWYHAGMICTGETYKSVVKMTFAKGASLEDPFSLFNASLEGSTRRAIDIHEGDAINESALKALIRAAVALNTASSR